MPTPTPPPSSTPVVGDPHVTYMTKVQLEAYLQDLRSGRPNRPAGSRPLPPSSYQQKRATTATAGASGGASQSISSSQSSPPRHAADYRRRDSYRRARTAPSVSFASLTTEYPPEPMQSPQLAGLEDEVSNMHIAGGPGRGAHRKTNSTASVDTIERELRESTPPVAPLRINKMKSPLNTANAYVPNPSRFVYTHPNQFNKPLYTTNPVPLPTPPPDVDEGKNGKRDIGTREERGRPPVPTIKVQRQNTTEPPVIAIVDAPLGTGRGFSGGTTPPAVVRRPSIPRILSPDEEEETRGQSSVPMINVPGISISVDDTSVSSASNDTTPAWQPAAGQSRRPLPNPLSNSSPIRKSPSTYSTSGRPSASCTTCAHHISGRIVSALGSRFHPECFRCYHCYEKLEHVGFFPEPEKNKALRAQAAGVMVDDMDKRFFCHLDFHELFSPRCKNCQTPIEGEVVVACGETWHVGHFFCAECGDPFTADTRFVEKDKYAWCIPCYNKRYSSKCRKCKKPVTETVVKAMGGEWHVECFCCAIGEKAIRKCFGPHSSFGSSSTPAFSTDGNATKVTKPKERGIKRASSVIGLGFRRPSVDSGYGGDIEKSTLPAVAEAVTKEVAVAVSNLPTPSKEPFVATEVPATPPPRLASATGSLLRRIKSTRFGLRSSTPTPTMTPPRSASTLEDISEKETGASSSHSSRHYPERSGTPVPPLMKKLVAGLLAERKSII